MCVENNRKKIVGRDFQQSSTLRLLPQQKSKNILPIFGRWLYILFIKSLGDGDFIVFYETYVREYLPLSLLWEGFIKAIYKSHFLKQKLNFLGGWGSFLHFSSIFFKSFEDLPCLKSCILHS